MKKRKKPKATEKPGRRVRKSMSPCPAQLRVPGMLRFTCRRLKEHASSHQDVVEVRGVRVVVSWYHLSR